MKLSLPRFFLLWGAVLFGSVAGRPDPLLPAAAPGLSRPDRRLHIVTPPAAPRVEMEEASFSPDGAWLVIAAKEGDGKRSLVALNLRSFSFFSQPLGSHLCGAVFSPTGDRMAFHGRPLSIALWQPGGEPVFLPLSRAIPASQLVWSADGKRLACVQDQDDPGKSFVTIWDVATGTVVSRFATSAATIQSLEFSPAGENLAMLLDPSRLPTGRSNGARSISKLQLRSVSTGRALGSADLPPDGDAAFRYSSDGQRLFLLEEDTPMTFSPHWRAETQPPSGHWWTTWRPSRAPGTRCVPAQSPRK